jgi:signal peptidase I
MLRPRKPWLAAVLSLLLPGLGHLYSGEPRAASLVYLASFVVLGVAVAAFFLPLAPFNVMIGYVLVLAFYLVVCWDAFRRAGQSGPGYELRRYNRWYVYLGVYLISAFLLQSWPYDTVKAQVVEAFRIPSGAMEPTVQIGDFLYVAKWPAARRIEQGTPVVFASIEEPGLKVIKRIVGVPGDTLEMRRGVLYRNAERLPEPYVMHVDSLRSEDPLERRKMRSWQVQYLAALPDTNRYAPDLQDWGPILVPPDSFFALGDNRDASYDSRYYGFIPAAAVIGRPWMLYFSYDTESKDKSPLSRVRWHRLGRAVR